MKGYKKGFFPVIQDQFRNEAGNWILKRLDHSLGIAGINSDNPGTIKNLC